MGGKTITIIINQLEVFTTMLVVSSFLKYQIILLLEQKIQKKMKYFSVNIALRHNFPRILSKKNNASLRGWEIICKGLSLLIYHL